ncbi:MAG: acetyl-CoA carboxylase biotin carboxylase subunit [Xanthobacteraceae bacterium]
MKKITRVLIANRGEIAVRIIKACKALGIESVVTVSDADRDTLAAKMADRAVCIGPARALDSYLNVGAVVSAASGTGADAIHPGYGFLAEKPELARACKDNGVIFIGPPAELIEQMGNKIEARKIAAKLGVPVVPGSEKISSIAECVEAGRAIGFPLLLKAAAGGGGRGMRIVNSESDVRSAFEEASREAHAAFGDKSIYMEQYIRNARHVEVQILADRFGNVVHLGERDCSLQRRYQKIVEEAPAPHLDQVRGRIHEAAVTIARSAGYENAGTIEFIVDADTQHFFFLEMNTRIQVEHPVTEMITGVDLVAEQIRVADNAPLRLSQSDIRFVGHAIECRINAESAAHGFRPHPGRITQWQPPTGPGIRVDTHCYPGYLVPPFYDSLLAKLIVHAPSRAEAIKKMVAALSDFAVGGIASTIPFHRILMQQPDVIAGTTNVRWVEQFISRSPAGFVDDRSAAREKVV